MSPLPRAAESPAAILRTLEPSGLSIGDRTFDEVLASAYKAIAAAAERRALDRNPR